MKNSLLFLGIGAIVALIVVVGVAGFAFWLHGRFSLESENELDVTLWRPYRNREAGYEIKYPPRWILWEKGGSTILFDPKYSTKREITQNEYPQKDIALGGYISMYRNNLRENFDTFTEKLEATMKKENGFVETSKVKSDQGTVAIKIKTMSINPYAQGVIYLLQTPNGRYYYFIVPNPPHLARSDLTVLPPSPEENKRYEEISDFIVSQFLFSKSDLGN